MAVRIHEYVREDGSSPFREWFERFDPLAAAKVATATTRLSLGNTSNVKWFEGIGEYVIDWGPGYRIYLAREGDSLVVLFDGGTKPRQRSDISRALAQHAEYKARKRAPRKRTKRSCGAERVERGSS